MAADQPHPTVHRAEPTGEPQFVEAATWPIEPAALAALLDIGMTGHQIAQYFAVDRFDVEALCSLYGFHD